MPYSMPNSTSNSIEAYFKSLEQELNRAMSLANEARKRGSDPEPRIEIQPAIDLADRVEKLMGIKGIAKRIRELNLGREELALQIGYEIASEKITKFESKIQAIEGAIRTAVAILTEGVVAAPIEGIARVGIGKNDCGTSYLRIYYAGPIRSAGGTAQALSVLVADYVRRALGIDRYRPRKDEIERCVEEIPLYKQAQHLQYLPTEEEIRLVVQNCPICVDGEPTEDIEVSGYRNLERIETNRVRGGMALVIAEGIVLKAPKIKKHVEKLKLSDWEWLDFLISSSRDIVDIEDEEIEKPREKFLQDLIAGRPVFSHPSRAGGFRLRYGRARNSGFAAAGIHPATMVLLDDFIATGTQLKLEAPGKAAGIVPVDGIEGPTVKLSNGDVLRVQSIEQAYALRGEVMEILDVGEILINYGDFMENNHPLLPSSYCIEWWMEEVKQKQKTVINPENAEQAIQMAMELGIPLHPNYTYLWHDIDLNEFKTLSQYVAENGKLEKNLLLLPKKQEIKQILEKLLVPHKLRDCIIIEDPMALIHCLGLDRNLKKKWKSLEFLTTIEAVNALSGLIIRERAPTRIGGRMGRPEKSKEREMRPPVHVLFPIGEAGGRRRSLQEAMEYSNSNTNRAGEIEVEIGIRKCPNCKELTFKNRCKCGSFTAPANICSHCNLISQTDTCPRCHRVLTSVVKQKINLKELYKEALRSLNEQENFEILKGVAGLISKNKTPEPIEKGILRAKHNVYVFKDGTIRYDLTDLPLTHFIPREINLSIEKIRELGYEYDAAGEPLKSVEQLVELKPQDVILSQAAGKYFVRVAKFIDDLLVKYYKLEPYYNVEQPQDLIGKLIIGLAPHTSAGVLGRIIGFTNASACYAHPYFHAAKRRNCDGDEDSVILLLDALLNFSCSYLPEKRGGKMDAPLVLTIRVDPKEVDKEAHNIDIAAFYPLEFYEATLKHANPKEFEGKIPTIASKLETQYKYQGFKFTHSTSDIAMGPVVSAYKTLSTMMEKMEAQLRLARRIRAVDEKDVAERVINHHFLPDIIGNLHSFSKQQMRCVKCNQKYRRPPLRGICVKCGSRIILTIHEGTVKKYLEASMKIAEEYEVSAYTKQRLKLLSQEITSLFESDTCKQKELFDFL
ncbi:MAG: DNA polymerase II large subunit [Methanocellales archaeon]